MALAKKSSRDSQAFSPSLRYAWTSRSTEKPLVKAQWNASTALGDDLVYVEAKITGGFAVAER